MAPSAERMTVHQRLPSVKAGPPDKNLAVAVNYELALVDQFLADTRKRKRKDSDAENPIEESRTINSVPMEDDKGQEKKEAAVELPQGEFSGHGINRRMSMRDRGKREANLARNRIRYDFQLVPTARRNSDFLNGFRKWWMNNGDEDKVLQTSTPPAVRENGSDTENKEPDAQIEIDSPFRDDSTVLWLPSKRSDWEDCVSEMTSVCTQAAIRRHPLGAPFIQPLSREYIRDRIDIDDPQLGYQLRHKHGGWLQGFILFTNFTTWNLGFRWDSRHPASGIPASNGILVDRSGSLSSELASQPHSGDTNAGGVVFPTVAEISLLGGLGCGEYLLRMALDDIRARGQHNFVVLQATTMSRPFYEKFGFVRVGAICYFRQQVDDSVPLVGYRHWTHANESQKSLEKHGGPSYMMCLKLSGTTERSFFDRMLQLQVEDKPLIENLGAVSASTPAPKSGKKVSSIESYTSFDTLTPTGTVTQRKKPGRKVGWRKNALKSPTAAAKTEPGKRGRKRSLPSSSGGAKSTSKRTKSGRPRGRPPGSKTKSKTKVDESTSTPKPPAKKRRKASVGTAPGTANLNVDKNRAYHSIRGPDGRFVRVLMDENHQAPVTPPVVKRKRGRPPGKKNREKPIIERISQPPADRSSFVATTVSGKPLAIDPKRLKKQRVMSYPRDRLHFYNKVVRHKDGRKKTKYYFVLEFNEGKNLMCLVPMAATGTLSGQRNGRPRYTCTVLSDDSNFEILSPDSFEIIPATMIMKTPYVALEAWDIEV